MTSLRKTGLPGQQWECSVSPATWQSGTQLPVLWAHLIYSSWLLWAELWSFQSSHDISGCELPAWPLLSQLSCAMYVSVRQAFHLICKIIQVLLWHLRDHCLLDGAIWKPVVMWHLNPKTLLILPLPPVLKTFCSCAEMSDGNLIFYVETIWEKHSLKNLMIGNFCLYLVNIMCLWIKNCNFATITDV